MGPSLVPPAFFISATTADEIVFVKNVSTDGTRTAAAPTPSGRVIHEVLKGLVIAHGTARRASRAGLGAGPIARKSAPRPVSVRFARRVLQCGRSGREQP